MTQRPWRPHSCRLWGFKDKQKLRESRVWGTRGWPPCILKTNVNVQRPRQEAQSPKERVLARFPLFIASHLLFKRKERTALLFPGETDM